MAKRKVTKQVNTEGAAEELGLSLSRTRALLRTGRLVGAEKIGRDWIIPSPVLVDPPLKVNHRRGDGESDSDDDSSQAAAE